MTTKILALVNPSILVWARHEMGLTTEEAAKAIGISGSRLAACESGNDHLTFAQFRRAAETYRRPSAIFFLEQVPSSLPLPDFRRVPENRDEPLSTELRLDVRRIYQKRKAAIGLSEFGFKYDWAYVRSIQSTQDPEKTGMEIRNLLRIPQSFPRGIGGPYKAFNHWRTAIESLGTFVFMFHRVPVEEMRGLAIADRPYPTITVNRKDLPQARSFTLLHEFSHVLLGESTMCDISEQTREDTYLSQMTEAFCNHTAGAALVPRTVLENNEAVLAHGTSEEWTEKELQYLSSYFCVSREVVLRRLLVIGRTTRDFYRHKREEWANLPRFKKARVFAERVHERVLQTDGLTYTRLVLNALENNAISAGDASELFGFDLKHLSALEQLVSEKGK